MTFRNHDKGCFDENKNVNMRKGPRDALLPSFMEILIEIYKLLKGRMPSLLFLTIPLIPLAQKFETKIEKNYLQSL